MPVKVDAPPAPRLPFVVPAPSPSVSEHVFIDKTNDPSLTDVKVALAGLRTAVEAVHRGATAIFADETKTEGAKHIESAQFAYKVTRPALMSSDTAVQRLNAEISAIKVRISTPPPVRDVLASEIRSRLAGMAAADRMKAILGSIKSGDDAIAGAVLAPGAPPLLSGLADAEREHVRLNWSVARHADEVARLKGLEAAMAHLERAGKLALSYSLAVADRSIVDRAKASAQRAAEAMAEANRPLLN